MVNDDQIGTGENPVETMKETQSQRELEEKISEKIPLYRKILMLIREWILFTIFSIITLFFAILIISFFYPNILNI